MVHIRTVPAADAWTTAVGFEAAVALPELFLAVTRTRIRRPTSAAASVYDELVAPPIAGQFDPLALPPSLPHRTHWYANEVMVVLLDQPPAVALSV